MRGFESYSIISRIRQKGLFVSRLEIDQFGRLASRLIEIENDMYSLGGGDYNNNPSPKEIAQYEFLAAEWKRRKEKRKEVAARKAAAAEAERKEGEEFASFYGNRREMLRSGWI